MVPDAISPQQKDVAMKATEKLCQCNAQNDSFCDLPETVNYHFTSACNMRCLFCFAGFKDCSYSSLDQHRAIIRAIAAVPSELNVPRRLNFVGGEPTAYPYLEELLLEAHVCGLRTSIVSNGFNLIQKGLPESFRTLELLGLSIDSLNPETNFRIGRCVRNKVIAAPDWLQLVEQARAIGVPLKINTTVTAFNAAEDLSGFVEKVSPKRWKIFQGMVVAGQNDPGSHDWAVSRPVFDRFIQRNSKCKIKPVVEQESLMRGSYAMISPDGRFFDSAKGFHSYSNPILEVGIKNAWNQIFFDSSLFNKRTCSSSGKEMLAA
jgi:radical S-adenosyl methionine domain-containing protein 2